MSQHLTDTSAKLQDLKDLFAKFVQEREWEQFHTAKNLSMNIACEAAELMEHFLWVETVEQQKATFAQQRHAIEDEIADVLIALVALCNRYDVDLSAVFAHKVAKIAEKYPVELTKGKSDKYTAYMQQKKNS